MPSPSRARTGPRPTSAGCGALLLLSCCRGETPPWFPKTQLLVRGFASQAPDGTYFCAPASCDAARRFLPAPDLLPTLALLPANTSTVYVEYGKAPRVSLVPCSSSLNTTGCGAVAYQSNFASAADALAALESGVLPAPSAAGFRNGSLTDLAGRIQVRPGSTLLCLAFFVPYGRLCTPRLRAALCAQVTSTTACVTDGSIPCVSCNVNQAALAGVCLPGAYTFSYSVANTKGVVSTATRTLVIYQEGFVTLTVPLITGITNSTQVSEAPAHAVQAEDR